LKNVLLREKLDFDDFLPARRMVSTKISEEYNARDNGMQKEAHMFGPESSDLALY